MFYKYLEIRDEGTTIAALGMMMFSGEKIENRFLRHCGYPEDGSSIVLMTLYDQKATNDPYAWAALGKGNRTMPTAHNFIIDHWGEIKHGQVIDVQVILGEKTTPKSPEIGYPFNPRDPEDEREAESLLAFANDPGAARARLTEVK